MGQRPARKPIVILHCPACRTARKCSPVGSATVAGKRREVVQCGDRDCLLAWVPAREHVPADAPQAA
ncbi:hypothetical protein [Streptacidiphilus sp. PAMC 29251]